MKEIKVLRELDFRTIREEWMNIQLEEGTVIRFKSVLVRVFETGQHDPITGEPVYSVEGQNIVAARAPDELKGEPSEFIPPIQDLIKKKKPVEVKIRGITGDEWNEYELETGKRIRTKTVITKVLRIDGYYDKYGNPIYIVQSQMVATGSPEYEIIEGREKKDSTAPPSPERRLYCRIGEEKGIPLAYIFETTAQTSQTFGTNIVEFSFSSELKTQVNKVHKVFGILKDWKIDPQKLKDELRETYG